MHPSAHTIITATGDVIDLRYREQDILMATVAATLEHLPLSTLSIGDPWINESIMRAVDPAHLRTLDLFGAEFVSTPTYQLLTRFTRLATLDLAHTTVEACHVMDLPVLTTLRRRQLRRSAFAEKAPADVGSAVLTALYSALPLLSRLAIQSRSGNTTHWSIPDATSRGPTWPAIVLKKCDDDADEE